MSLTPGTKLGSYEIVSLLGSGGMGEVYKAKDLKLGRDVAIKVLRGELATDPERLRRFEQEARAASSLNHPNIVTIYDIGEQDSTRYIAMEYVEGKTLREMLGGEPLPTKKLLKLSTQIADGLAKAHSAGIVHRDLKPENLMVSSEGFVKILDFGLAKLMPEPSEADSELATVTKATLEGAVLGTVQYMSPEQAAGRSVDYHSDQFSFGSIMYEMATGKLAYQRDTTPETQAAIMRDEPEPITVLNPHVPAQLTHIIGRCLEKEPRQRYDSTRDLARELETVDELGTAPQAALPGSRRLPLAGVVGFGLVAVLVVIAVALFTGDVQNWIAGDGGSPQIESIAVLPLENLSGDPEQEYFADGMTDELIAELAQIGALKVISRTSIMQYKGTRKPLPEIARELGVDAIVEGTVRRAEGRVRITAQLIEAGTDQHLWAESFERDLQDVLTLQSEMARAIAQEIRSTLTPQEAERFATDQTTDPEAYEAYLKGRYHYYRLDVGGFERALEYYDEALQKDPDFALAYAGRAETYIHLELWGALRPGEGFGKARRAALRATDLEKTLAEAHVALAVIQFRHDWEFATAENTFRRAMALKPSHADAHIQYCYLLFSTGRNNEAIQEAKEAVKLDPLSSKAASVLQQSYQEARQYDLALSASQDVSKRWPSLFGSHYQLAQIYTLMERLPEALSAAETSVQLSSRNPWTLAQLGSIYGLMGRDDDAREVLAELELKRSRQHVPALALAWVNIGLGEKDRAVEWLESAYEEREGWLVEMYRFPLLDSLRDHPGFVDIFRRMNLPE